LIEGIGASIDILDAGTLYEVCGRLAPLLAPADVKAALQLYVKRLVSDIPEKEPVHFDGADVPQSPIDALARYIFSLMSDIEVGTRWRAAHCLRRLVRYGNASVLASIVSLWPRQFEKSFRDEGSPFYWQAARLWLAVTISRIATERPKSIVPFAGLILEALRDANYPHPTLRSFAQDTLRTLEATGEIELNDEDRKAVEMANTSALSRKTRERNGSSRVTHSKSERRFDFNSMDTIPYWFQPAAEVFANVSVDDLRDEAERWIVDRWKIDPQYSKWNAEPRQKRLPERSWDLRSNDHGSQPKIEDYRTFLEWYSLQCAVGSLMNSNALASSSYDDAEEDEFESRLQRQKLTDPPFWLADLLSAKPCEPRFWDHPSDGESWLKECGDKDFVRELMRGSNGTQLVVSSSVEAASSEFTWSARVDSALVEPVNALALVRALQTTDEPMDYKLPNAGDPRGDRFEIERLRIPSQLVAAFGRF
jgi:hypothetical protein